jgi:hypothetical protein
VAPAKAGKTTVLQAIMKGVATNYPEAVLMVLLVDERPEEVTEMQMLGIGEVIASSFDCPAERHVSVAEMVLEHARRQVESGRDVVIVLDSLTRLARAYNTTERGTGKLLSGGIDSGALEKPKRFFGSARKVRGGTGSLTIIATALIDTGSRGDEVIFEEFKGTGNSEIVLDRGLADKRIFPAIDIEERHPARGDALPPRAARQDLPAPARAALAVDGGRAGAAGQADERHEDHSPHAVCGGRAGEGGRPPLREGFAPAGPRRRKREDTAVSCPPAGGGSAPLGTVVSFPTAREARPVAQRRGTPTPAVAVAP